jgi:branched-chain amino acid transport system permease protein
LRGALVGALVVGGRKAVATAVYPEAEMLAVYVIVIGGLLLRPAGLFARATA